MKSVPLSDLRQPATVEQLTKFIADTQIPWEARRQFALTLGRMGAAATPAIPTLRGLLRNSEADPVLTRQWALKALGLMGPPASAVANDAAEFALDQSQPFLIRATALETVALVDAGQGIALRSCLQVMRAPTGTGEDAHQSEELRLAAVDSLAQLGLDAVSALPDLLRMGEHPWPLLRRGAALAIGKLGPRADSAVGPLTDILTLDDAPEVREAAAEALGQLGETGMQRLSQLLGTPESSLQLLAIHGLQKSPDSRRSVAALAAVPKTASDNTRVQAASAILVHQPRHAAAVATLIELLAASERSARLSAYETLRDGPVENLQPHRAQLQVLSKQTSGSSQTVTAAANLLRRLEEGTQGR